MKYLVLIEINDIDIQSTWHNGSSITTIIEHGFTDKDVAKTYGAKFCENIHKEVTLTPHRQPNSKRYDAKALVLSYEDEDIADIEAIFEWKTISRTIYRKYIPSEVIVCW